jgi:hypothetical protein
MDARGNIYVTDGDVPEEDAQRLKEWELELPELELAELPFAGLGHLLDVMSPQDNQ